MHFKGNNPFQTSRLVWTASTVICLLLLPPLRHTLTIIPLSPPQSPNIRTILWWVRAVARRLSLWIPALFLCAQPVLYMPTVLAQQQAAYFRGCTGLPFDLPGFTIVVSVNVIETILLSASVVCCLLYQQVWFVGMTYTWKGLFLFPNAHNSLGNS